MSYIDSLITKYNLMGSYEECWSEGGSYGTCWDEAGPTELACDEPISPYSFEEYIRIIEKLYNSRENELLMKHDTILRTGTTSESDYYGGCADTGYISFHTRDLLKSILRDKYPGLDSCTDDNIKEFYPELLLRFALKI